MSTDSILLFICSQAVFLLIRGQKKYGYVFLTKALKREAAELFWFSFMLVSCFAAVPSEVNHNVSFELHMSHTHNFHVKGAQSAVLNLV